MKHNQNANLVALFMVGVGLLSIAICIIIEMIRIAEKVG
jgi:hypothetical protein